MVSSYLVACIVLFVVTYCDGMDKMSFQSPNMTAEEQHSMHMPANLQCDACKIVAYQITNALKKEESKRSGKRLKESDYLDLLEGVCASKVWNEYGIKSVNGVNRISGPGTEAANFAGMMHGGGMWPGRLVMKCSNFLGDIGEDEIYEDYRENKDLETFLCIKNSKDCVDSSKPSSEKKEL